MYIRTSPHQNGFTLVETLVAITILLLVVIGPMTIAARGMKMGFYANEQTTAIYLAQEGVEWVQKLRDDVALDEFDTFKAIGTHGGDTMSWYTDGDFGPCTAAAGCDVDLSQNTLSDQVVACQPIANCNLLLDVAGSPRVYGYTGGVLSPYTRIIEVGPLANGGVPVTVTVSWDSGLFGAKSVVLQTYVYDQYARFK